MRWVRAGSGQKTSSQAVIVKHTPTPKNNQLLRAPSKLRLHQLLSQGPRVATEVLAQQDPKQTVPSNQGGDEARAPRLAPHLLHIVCRPG